MHEGGFSELRFVIYHLDKALRDGLVRLELCIWGRVKKDLLPVGWERNSDTMFSSPCRNTAAEWVWGGEGGDSSKDLPLGQATVRRTAQGLTHLEVVPRAEPRRRQLAHRLGPGGGEAKSLTLCG
jgi:hypothetical protein